MIRNGNFTEGWQDMPPAPGFLVNQQPNGWELEWLEPGESLYDDPGSQARGVPECVHKLSRQLPPHEQLGQPNALILAGDTTYKIFHAHAPFGATLSQTVTGLEPGSSATLTVPIQLHLHGEQDPFGAESGVWVNGEGGWAHGQVMGDRRWFRHVIPFTVPADGRAEVVIRVKSKWPRPKDFFIDHVTLAATAEEPGEAPPPDEWEEMSRQTLSLAEAAAGDRLRLDVSTRPGNQWRLQQSISESLLGESKLDVVLLRRTGPMGGGFAFAAGAKGIDLEAAAPPSGQRVLGMDVSYAQAFTVDFGKAADAGVRYCFIRAASGKNEKDENFEHQFREAGRAGMLRGIYYYLYPESAATAGDPTPEGQARRFAALLKPEAELGAVLDVEDQRLTPAEVRRFVDEFQKHDPYDRPITLYTAAWFWNAARGFSGSAVDWAANHPLWVAHYTSTTQPIKPGNAFQVAIPRPWRSHTFHQWTSVGGSLVGHGEVGLDLNYFPGSLSDLQAWAGADGATQPEEPAVVGTKYVAAPAGLNLRSAPTTNSDVLKTMPWGQAVTVLAEGPWDHVEVEGVTGYASSEFLSTENPVATGEAQETFAFRVWPTAHKEVIQRFGERPDFYRELTGGFLPGHEGVDLKAPFGTPYFCVAPGRVTKVTDRRRTGDASPYGWHVVVDHGNGYTTLYAHAAPDVLVTVGQEVAAGQILAHSGNTGESSGPHLHITLRKQGHQRPGWPAGFIDPWPFLAPLFATVRPPMGNLSEGYLYGRYLEMRDNGLALATATLNFRDRPDGDAHVLAEIPAGSTVRVLSTTQENGYYHCEASVDMDAQPQKVREQPRPGKLDLLAYVKGDGRQYEVRNAFGSQERFRTEVAGLTFYLVKNAQWEQFFYDNDFIYRDVDTSPGGGRYYRLTDPDRERGSRWLRRRMALGETYTQTRRVQFYNKADGSPSAANSGTVTDTIKLVAHHGQFEFQTGVTVDDVVEIHWVKSAQDHTPKEKYFYANGMGMVGWARGHADPNSPAWSAVADIHDPGAREPIPRERVTIR